MADMGTTPFATLTPLLYAHANFLDMVLRGSYFRFVPLYMGLVVLVGMAILLGALFTRFSLPLAAMIMGGVVLGVATVDYMLFSHANLIAPGAMPLLLPPLAYGLIASYRYIFMERRVSEHEKELRVARTIQMELLPAEPPTVADLDVFGTNIPAKAVAGDYFDWIELSSGSLAVAIGDVSGKGVSSSLLMSHLRASLHAEVRGSEAPGEIVAAMNISLTRAIEAHHFATFFLAVVRSEEKRITYCNAGHSPVLLVSEGKVEHLQRTGLPLGILEDTPYTGETRAFGPGDHLVACTDGVTEARHRDEFYGDARLNALVASLAAGNLPAKEFGEAILADVRSFTGHDEYDDDLTIVVVKHAP
jgi:sigma-B regulation protein RsbU (phosphoserine phosphatase)